IVINKAAGWLFDGYRSAGIARSFAQAQMNNLGGFLEKIKALSLVNKHGEVVNLNTKALADLPGEVVTQLQAVDAHAFEALKNLQGPLVQERLTVAYTLVFAFCALAYLMAWAVMYFLVPRFKRIEDL
ncbi:MAG TPA: hypothetical protein PLG50_09010, partial [bacterium]|nr:hypothetical protein [bacterium]